MNPRRRGKGETFLIPLDLVELPKNGKIWEMDIDRFQRSPRGKRPSRAIFANGVVTLVGTYTHRFYASDHRERFFS